MLVKMINFVSLCSKWTDKLQPYGLLIGRLYLFKVFFNSALIKINNFEQTLYLFQYEYQVPFLPFTWAAYAGTAAEAALPVMLVLGLFGRLPAIGLFIFNGVMVVSYPFLHTPEGICALNEHILWAFLSGTLIIFGSGFLGLDNFINKKYPDYKY